MLRLFFTKMEARGGQLLTREIKRRKGGREDEREGGRERERKREREREREKEKNFPHT